MKQPRLTVPFLILIALPAAAAALGRPLAPIPALPRPSASYLPSTSVAAPRFSGPINSAPITTDLGDEDDDHASGALVLVPRPQPLLPGAMALRIPRVPEASRPSALLGRRSRLDRIFDGVGAAAVEALEPALAP